MKRAAGASALLALTLGAFTAGSGSSLPPCPPTPNCVSTLADPEDAVHSLPPLLVPGERAPERVLEVVRTHLLALPRVRLEREEGLAIEATVRSLVFRFVDEIHVFFDQDAGSLHLRSAARTGGFDFDVNRRRATALLRAIARDLGVSWP